MIYTMVYSAISSPTLGAKFPKRP
jgi:hypothetical protein